MQFTGEGEDGVLLDPDAVDTPVFESAPWSTAPAPPTQEGADVEPTVEVEQSREPLPEFDPRYRKDWEGLVYLGYLTKSLSFLGHRFVIRTVDVDAILEIGMLHQPYVGTISDLKAYQALLLAAAVTKVDGKPLAIPLGEDDTDLEARFQTVRKWYPVTLDFLYNEYLLLEKRVEDVVAAMREGHLVGGASGEADSTPGLSPASA